jgi:hypothetical protein
MPLSAFKRRLIQSYRLIFHLQEKTGFIHILYFLTVRVILSQAVVLAFARQVDVNSRWSKALP